MKLKCATWPGCAVVAIFRANPENNDAMLVRLPVAPVALSVASRASTPMMLFPSPVAATVADAYVVAGVTGGLAIAAHLAGVLIVRLLPESKRPVILADTGYAVYKIVGLAFALLQTALGWMWYFPAAGSVAASRLLVPDGSVRFLAAVVLGSLVLWDLPCAFFIKKLRKADMIIHHAAFAFIGYLMLAHLPNRYGLYYLGAQELSTLPVCLWNLYDAAYDEATTPPLAYKKQVTPALVEKLAAARDNWQLVAAAFFVVMRGFEFTRITLSRLLPDMLAVLPTAQAASMALTLRLGLGFCLAFNGLQLFWLFQILSVMLGKIFGGDDAAAPSDADAVIADPNE